MYNPTSLIIPKIDFSSWNNKDNLNQWVFEQVLEIVEQTNWIISESDIQEFQELENEQNWASLQGQIFEIINDKDIEFQKLEINRELELVVNDFFDWNKNYTSEDLWIFINIIFFIWEKLKYINWWELLSDKRLGWLSEKYMSSNFFDRLTSLFYSIQIKDDTSHWINTVDYKEELKNVIIGILFGNYDTWTDIIDLCGKLEIINDELETL